MFRCLLLSSLIIASLSFTVLLRSSPDSTSIIYPQNQQIVIEPNHNLSNPDYIGNYDAQWIWVENGQEQANGYAVTFQALFQADCQKNIVLKATADNYFTAYLNNQKIGGGDVWYDTYTFPITPKCGQNNLTIVSTNLGDGTPGGLIFAVVQDPQIDTKYCIVKSNLTNSVIVSSSDQAINLQPVLQAYHNANNPNFVGQQAQWVWVQNGHETQQNYTLTFQSLFYGDCNKTAQLKVTADNEYIAYLNDKMIGYGSTWTQPQKFQVNLICAQNNLTIVAINHGAGTPGGLIYAMTQQSNSVESSCYLCQNNWSYNKNTCNCQCPKKRCPSKYVQDKTTCKCVCDVKPCQKNANWDNNQCKCVIGLKSKSNDKNGNQSDSK